MNATDVVRQLLKALDRLAIPHMAVGSFSSNAWGEVRSTKDADFVVNMEGVSAAQLLSALGPGFLLDPQMTFETVTGTVRWRIRHPQSAFLIELFQLSDDPHDQMRFQRRTTHDVGGQQASIAAAEDVVITKLRWSTNLGRSKDLDDIRGILRVQHGLLDLKYIREWADVHGTRDVLESLLAEQAHEENG